ncbi:MAG: adenine nucleotide alpha hydrolase [Pedobacter sp.]|nr:MAG: adenine nucleotide alpha hydrolase [Pedobacter sp.]
MSELAVMNWSGGKDSMLALHYLLGDSRHKLYCLLTTVNESYRRIAMHGVREELLQYQALALGVPLKTVYLPESPDMVSYEAVIDKEFKQLKSEGVTVSVFGDIFLEDLKHYREDQFNKIGLATYFPLWKMPSRKVVEEFIDLGYKTIIVCAKEGLQDFCGRVIDRSFLDELPADVDPCGENGEFHTFVFDGPQFNVPVNFELGELVFKEFPSPVSGEGLSGYWYVDLVPFIK